MTSVLIFNTLQYANRLKAAGVPEKQAEIQAETLAEVIDNQLTTKQDLKELELKIDLKIKSIKRNLIIQLGSIIVGGFSILGVLIIVFQK
jgi:uncharacterized membrane protein